MCKNENVDLLMIYPPWTVLSSRGILTNALPPLGILTIAAHAERQGFNVKVIDIHVERLSQADFHDLVAQYKPKVVGVTVLSSMISVTHAIIKEVKDIVPSCKTVVGGVHAELYPEEMLSNPSLDFVVRGDGEDPILELLEGKAKQNIRGLIYRNETDDGIILNPLQEMRMELDFYPMPAYHLVDMNKYFPSASSYKNLPASNVIMTRGCPGKCTFCNSARTVLRSHSPKRIFEQIKNLRETYGIRQIQFFDDTFTVNKKGVFELCDLLIEDRTDITFSCYARGDCWSEDIAAKLKQAGCHQIMVGIETGSERIAKVIGKPINKEKYKKLVEIAHRFDIEVRAGFIIGSMTETWESMEESLQFAIDLDVDFFQLSISTPYPGTQLFRDAENEGRIRHKDYKFYGQSEPIVQLDDLSGADILRFEKYAIRKFYMRPPQLIKQLKRLTNLSQIKDLINAFSLLIGNRLVNQEPQWQAWDDVDETDYCVLNLPSPLSLHERLTNEIRLQAAE